MVSKFNWVKDIGNYKYTDHNMSNNIKQFEWFKNEVELQYKITNNMDFKIQVLLRIKRYHLKIRKLIHLLES